MKAGDLKSLDSSCLTRINTLINLLINKKVKTEEVIAKAKEESPMTATAIDECLAELFYLLRAVDTAIQHHDSEKGLRMFNQIVLGKDCDESNK